MTPRILIAKIGLDGHDRGALIITRALRDAGMEVVYLGMRNTVETVVNTALQEDPDVVGISLLSNVHRKVAPRLVAAMREAGLQDVPVLFGGTIPASDAAFLRDVGITEVFPTGSSLDQIVEFCRDAAGRRSDLAEPAR